jgi:hypothetical protein
VASIEPQPDFRYVHQMFSYFQRRVAALPFRTDRDDFARRSVEAYAQTTLNAFLDGKEKAWAVRDVIKEVRANFGEGAVMPIALMEAAITAPEGRQLALITKAIDLLAKQVREGRAVQP